MKTQLTTQSTFNDYKLKKGDKVFLFGNWNGYENVTNQWYIQEYTIHSIGKKRCYLIIGEDRMSKQEYYCDFKYGIATTLEKAQELCKTFIEESIKIQIEDYTWRAENWRDYKQEAQRTINAITIAKNEIVYNPITR